MSDGRATPYRAADLPPSEKAIYDRIPSGEDYINTGEVAYRLHHFKALHALERKGLIEVDYGYMGDETFVRRSDWDA